MAHQITTEVKAVPCLDARLTASERAFRKSLLDLIIQAGQPVTPAELASDTGRSIQECAELVSALQAKGLLVRNHGGEIAFVYPVSSLPTPHRVTLADGRSFYAMCAIDALGSSSEFAQDATVTSSCS
ncbi:MAG: hypothetical protein HGA96_01315 [Desulfobulbaceae bacterium]|nr:hypothetical protein [Desulfobulbaceae bacterium]